MQSISFSYLKQNPKKTHLKLSGLSERNICYILYDDWVVAVIWASWARLSWSRVASFLCLGSYLGWLGSLSKWSLILKEASLSVFTWWPWVPSSKRGQAPMHVYFSNSLSVMFANIPLVKTSHVAKSRFKVGQGRTRFHLLMGKNSKSQCIRVCI